MRHRKSNRKFGRTPEHRRALFANLSMALIENGRIKTTDTKAKSLRRVAEKLVSLGKSGTLDARRRAYATLGAPGKHRRRDGEPSRAHKTVDVLFGELAERFRDRPGGYTRIVKIGHRHGDNAPMSYIEFVDYQPGEASE